MDYAQGASERWCPAEAFVMDVALTVDGYKIIEYNNINSAGFYASDVDRYVDAMETTFVARSATIKRLAEICQ